MIDDDLCIKCDESGDSTRQASIKPSKSLILGNKLERLMGVTDDFASSTTFLAGKSIDAGPIKKFAIALCASVGYDGDGDNGLRSIGSSNGPLIETDGR